MDDFEKFYNKALRFLSFRPRSEKEIRDYLKGVGRPKSQKNIAPDGIIDLIINKLKEYKFLNDEEFVKWWIEQRTAAKPKAWRVIKMELKQKGIQNDLIDSFELKDKNDLENAIKLAKSRMRRYENMERQDVYEKLGRYLASKGFNYDIIKEVIDQILPK